MRTTLKIDDDVFETAQELANSTERAVDAVLSELARSGPLRTRLDLCGRTRS
jgi:predicted transcriptional regulator